MISMLKHPAFWRGARRGLVQGVGAASGPAILIGAWVHMSGSEIFMLAMQIACVWIWAFELGRGRL